MTTAAISEQDCLAAAIALKNITVCSPLLENPDVNAFLGGRLLVKAESMQRTGAFKIRGAYNRIRQLSSEEKRRGVITYSSGNHAQGVALASRLLGSSALIVMPDDTPDAKKSATRKLGASITTFNRDTDSSDDIVSRLSRETKRVIVPPNGNPQIHAGAGTVALELIEQAQKFDAHLDAVLVPCGGGGLTAATAFLMQIKSPATEVYSVEPELFDDTRRSLAAGHRVANPKGRRTICDAIMTPMPNEMTFAINQKLLSGGLVVSDDEVRQAMRFAYDAFKIVVEPGAAVGIAAVLSTKIDIAGKTIATIITGGNIDAERFHSLISVSPKEKIGPLK
jgi:threonine dehydratase